MKHACMKSLLTVRRTMLLATTCALLQHGGPVLAQEGAASMDSVPVVETRRAMNTLTPQPVSAAIWTWPVPGRPGSMTINARHRPGQPAWRAQMEQAQAGLRQVQNQVLQLQCQSGSGLPASRQAGVDSGVQSSRYTYRKAVMSTPPI
jgi:hypothetical protein